MSIFDSQIEWKPVDETPTGSGDSLTNIQKLTMGSGSNRWEANIKDGFWMGADTFATAPFSVDFLGALTASSVTIKTSGGTVLIDSDSSTQNFLEVINTKLDTTSKEILSDFDFGSTDYAGAVKAGDITWNTTTGAITGGSGVVVYRKGIVGANAGSATFTLDATTGDATFAGTLSAPSGTLGTITGGTITGVTINSSSGTNKITVNTGNYIQFFVSSTETGRIYADSSGDLYLQGTDDVIFRSGGSNIAQVVSAGLMPFGDKTKDLGREGASTNRWRNIYGETFYGGANGTAGATFTDSLGGSKTSGTVGFVTSIRISGSSGQVDLDAKYREFQVQGGIMVGVSNESDWIFLDSATGI